MSQKGPRKHLKGEKGSQLIYTFCQKPQCVQCTFWQNGAWLHGAWATAGCCMVHRAGLDAPISIWPKANVTAIEKTFGYENKSEILSNI